MNKVKNLNENGNMQIFFRLIRHIFTTFKIEHVNFVKVHSLA